MSFVINLKDERWLERQKVAGKAVATCLFEFKDMIDNVLPNLSLKDIEAHCQKLIKEFDCTPTFHGYKGFPGIVCLSVNKNMVHGIPTDYVLKEGDVVTLDLGATFEGAIADAALSCIYGKPKKEEHVRLLNLCQESLYRGIDAIEVGRNLGCIGQAIYRHTRNSGFYLIENYGGHGIDYNQPHADPFVPNKSKADEGPELRNGMSLAIEPMLSMKSNKTRLEVDGWTVSTRDISCHFEHSVLLWEGEVIIMTDWESLCTA